MAAKPVEDLRTAEACALQREIRQAHESLQICFGEMEKVLASPVFDASALTSVRLKLAGIRLTRGPLITRVANLLSGSMTEAEAALLEQLHSSHYQLLKAATEHTGKWTLHAIAANWPCYRRETRELMRRWVNKADLEQRLVYPLVQRCAGRS